MGEKNDAFIKCLCDTDIYNTGINAFDTKIENIYDSIYDGIYKINCYDKMFMRQPKIKKVIFNNPATIVYWEDRTKTVVKCEKEKYDPEKGLAMAIAKKALGNQGNYFEVFKKWIGEDKLFPERKKEKKQASKKKSSKK